MGANIVVIMNVLSKQILQVILVQRDDMVKQITADNADKMLTNPVLPWTVWRDIL